MLPKKLSLAMLSAEIKKSKPTLITVTYSTLLGNITKIFFDDQCFWKGSFVYTGCKAVSHDDAYDAIIKFLSQNYREVNKNTFSTS